MTDEICHSIVHHFLGHMGYIAMDEIKLYKHQEDGISYVMSRGGSGALVWEMGTGKTVGGIEIFARLRSNNPALKCLVVCPITLIESAWGNDIRRFTQFTHLNCHDIGGLPDEIDTDILVINYEQVRLERNIRALYALTAKYPMLCILDESTKIKAYDAKITKVLLNVAKRFQHRVVMSGKPTPNSELEWWSQINFVDPFILGSSFHQFKNTYFHLERHGQKLPQGAFLTRADMSRLFKQGAEYKITDANRRRMMERISPYCSLARKAECLDLPEQVDEIREVEMSADQSRIYKDMRKHLIAELSDLFGSQSYIPPAVAQNALTKLAKLREITSGFVINEQQQSVEVSRSKINELENLVDELPNEPVIVWGNFRWEIRRIAEMLSAYGKVSTCYGETDDKDAEIEAFKSGDTRFFVAHPLSAGYGLTLTNCSTAIFYSLSHSYEQYDQSRARIHRIGQTKKCTYIHLLAKNSIDQEILDVVRGKHTAQEMLLGMIQRRAA